MFLSLRRIFSIYIDFREAQVTDFDSTCAIFVIERARCKATFASDELLCLFVAFCALEDQLMMLITSCSSCVFDEQLVFQTVQAVSSFAIFSLADVFSRFDFLTTKTLMPAVLIEE